MIPFHWRHPHRGRPAPRRAAYASRAPPAPTDAWQAVCAVLAGTIADQLTTHLAVAVLAGLSLVATLSLTRGLRRTRPDPVSARPVGFPDQHPSGC
ncbi:hypothetical protein [Micromonospora sp. LOL_023]|uniref:hypothetical protein n=1 Tax=Micromonospora sp. LOL_023 TaxID=3345418 RepID=UPI003A889E67